MNIILKPFSWLLVLFYNFFNNYGLALILFAVVVKLVLFPFSLKGKKSMVKMNMLSGKAQRLQKQYANNKEMYQQELAKLYEKEQVNPMGGCLWSFLPILFLFPLYAIIRQPLTHMMGLAADQIVALANNVLNWSQVAVENGWIKEAAALTEQTSGAGYYQLYLASLINGNNLSAVQAVAPGAFPINFQFLGINLAQVPTWKVWEPTYVWNWNNIGLTLMPIISAALSLLMSVVMQKTNNINNPQAAAQSSSNMMMYVLSPLMSLWIGYVMPAGLCVYWIINSLLSMVQEFISAQMLKKDYAEAAEAARKQELLDKEEEKRRKAALAKERAKRAEEKKKGGKKKDKPKDAAPGVDVTASRVGIRAYARGRAYDPQRFGGVTDYRDPDHPVDEEAIEKVRAARAEKAEEAKLEADVTAQVAAEMETLAQGSAEEVAQAIEKLDEERSQELMDEAAELAAAVTGETADEAPAEPAAEETEGGDVTPAPELETPKYDAPDYSEEKKDE